MKCSNCGVQVADDAKFCSKCGRKVNQKTPPPLPGKTVANRKINRRNAKSENRHGNRLIAVIAAVFVIVVIGMVIIRIIDSSFLQNKENPDYISEMPISENTGKSEENKSYEYKTEVADSDMAKAEETTTSSDYSESDYQTSYCYKGYFVDTNGNNPVRLEFDRSGDEITNCVYTNVQLGGKIRMTGEVNNGGYYFKGKDGSADFVMDLYFRGNPSILQGTASVGSKALDAYLELVK